MDSTMKLGSKDSNELVGKGRHERLIWKLIYMPIMKNPKVEHLEMVFEL